MPDTIAIGAIVLFIAGMSLLRVGQRTNEVLSQSRQAFSILRDNDISDDQKEIAARAASVSLLQRTFGLVCRILAAAVVPAAITMLMIFLGIVSPIELTNSFFSIPMLLLAIGAAAAHIAWSRWRS